MGLFSALLKKKTSIPSSVSPPIEEKPARNNPYITRFYIEKLQREKGVLSSVHLGGYQSPSGGYLNYARFSVVGRNETTGRKNTRKYSAKTAADALALASSDGLIDPEIKEIIPHSSPTQQQIDDAKAIGATIPSDACSEDAYAILFRINNAPLCDDCEDEDDDFELHKENSIECHEVDPLPSPTEEFAQYADSLGLHFSKFSSLDTILRYVVYSLNDRDKAAFFAYCVFCLEHATEIGNLQTCNQISKFYQFADSLLANNQMLESLLDKHPDSYLKLDKKSKLYKEVIKFL